MTLATELDLQLRLQTAGIDDLAIDDFFRRAVPSRFYVPAAGTMTAFTANSRRKVTKVRTGLAASNSCTVTVETAGYSLRIL
jgi:hypothetical protein